MNLCRDPTIHRRKKLYLILEFPTVRYQNFHDMRALRQVLFAEKRVSVSLSFGAPMPGICCSRLFSLWGPRVIYPFRA